jgi:4-nitrophenyl phosphatase
VNQTSAAPPRGLMVDMDGVLYRGEKALPGLKDFLALARGRPFVLLTNNSTMSAADGVAKLARMGAQVPVSVVHTVSDATGRYLASQLPVGSRALVLGSPALKDAVAGAGMELVGSAADVVVVGLDVNFSYATLAEAVRSVNAGAKFVATSLDSVLLTEDGVVPGAGALVAAVQACVAAKPVCVGKPSRPMFETAVQVLGLSPEEILMIGDNLASDVVGGAAIGARTALLLSGLQDNRETAHPPDLVFTGLPELTEFLAAAWAA